MMDPTKPPFSCTGTPEFIELLAGLNCSLVLSTYQAGKVILLSSTDGERLTQLPRTFESPMGMAVEDNRLAIATRHEIVLLANDPRLAPSYPNRADWYDAMYAPRAAFYCGAVFTHDMAFTPNGLVAVNTLFSCLFRPDFNHSFVPLWQPPFISALTPEDRCHLNGLALVDGQPRYVTALGTTDEAGGWRPDKLNAGVLMDITTNEILLHDLAMPHSPRVYDGGVYVLLSATGEVVKADLEAGSYEVVNRLPGFVRGMSRLGDYLFIGLSHLRKSHTFGDLPLAQEGATQCGVTALHLPTGAIVGGMKYINSCNEIYDVQVLPGMCRPGILGTATPMFRRALTLPDATYWGKSEEEIEAQRAAEQQQDRV